MPAPENEMKPDVTEVPQLETDRLWLRPIRRDDAEDIFEYTSRPEVSRFTSWETHASLDDTLAYIEQAGESRPEGQYTWSLVDKESGKVVGNLNVTADRAHRRASLGYQLSPDYQGRGLMTEAAGAAVDFAFDRLGANRVEAVCSVKNGPSRKVMERLGMRREGTLRDYMTVKGKPLTVHMYSIVRADRSPDTMAT